MFDKISIMLLYVLAVNLWVGTLKENRTDININTFTPKVEKVNKNDNYSVNLNEDF